ncbi:MAG: flagellar basal-body MS-ring/collar protein FliF [Fibrobacterota bacterium]
MGEFFKQLLAQLNDLWNRLTGPQKVITGAVLVLSFTGLVLLIVWSNYGGSDSGYSTLFTGLDLEESATIVEKLKEGQFDYQIENGGTSIMVPKKNLHELRLTFAKLGLPRSGSIGYEIFDKPNLGMTDFVQNLNYKRALEGELAKTMEELVEIRKARVHIVIPKPTIFTDKQKPATASVVLKLKLGSKLKKDQVFGIARLISSSVEGLEARNVSIVDSESNILSDTFGDNEVAEKSSNQLELRRNVERHLSNKLNHLLEGILGPGKARVSVSSELNFEQIEKTMEQFDPESRVLRSQERSEGLTSESPTGNERSENSISNYEINKTVTSVISEVGNIDRVSISVAVDGKYKYGEDGKREFVARTEEEMQKLDQIVKNAVGYDAARGDQVNVYGIQFDTEFLDRQMMEIEKEERWEFYREILKVVLIFMIIVVFILFLKYLAGNIIDAMNPPVPEMVAIGDEDEDVDMPETTKKSNELVEKVEYVVLQEPKGVAELIRSWLNEDLGGEKKK